MGIAQYLLTCAARCEARGMICKAAEYRSLAAKFEMMES